MPAAPRTEALASAGRLLTEGRYDEAAELVLRLEREHEHAGEAVWAEILGAAHELCHACREHHLEVESHQRAIGVVGGIEQRLRKRLNAILDYIAGGSLHTPAAETPITALAQPAMPVVVPHSESGRGVDADVRRVGRAPVLAVYCLGPFRVYQDDRCLAPWPNRRAKGLLKYLIVHRARPVPKEVLMEHFWPEASASAARNNLNVTVYALRRFLRAEDSEVSHVLFQDDCYLLNPEVDTWVDVEEFDRLVAASVELERRGQVTDAVKALESAESLFHGSLFADDPYEDWMMSRRRELQDAYLDVLERLRKHYRASGDVGACTTVCRKMLMVDSCREDAHMELMRCYARQGQHHLALRQYRDCYEALGKELGTSPSGEITRLYERLHRHEPYD